MFYEIDSSFLVSYRRGQEGASLRGFWTVWSAQEGGLYLSSLQLDLPPQSLRRQNPACRARVPRKFLGWVWTPSFCPFPAPTSGPDSHSLCLSSTVSSPCGLQACFCQLKPCQEGLVGVLPAAGASPQRPQPPKPPQIQSWHVHNSLHCGEGSSPRDSCRG